MIQAESVKGKTAVKCQGRGNPYVQVFCTAKHKHREHGALAVARQVEESGWESSELPEETVFDHTPGERGVQMQINDTSASEACKNFQRAFAILDEHFVANDLVKQADVPGLKESLA